MPRGPSVALVSLSGSRPAEIDLGHAGVRHYAQLLERPLLTELEVNVKRGEPQRRTGHFYQDLVHVNGEM